MKLKITKSDKKALLAALALDVSGTFQIIQRTLYRAR